MCVACNHTIHRASHHFGWNRDFAPALTASPGETIHFECLDSSAGQLGEGSTVDSVRTLDFSKVNPVTGPVFVEGAEPGDAPAERRERTAELLRRVGLSPDHAIRYPHEFSGGQRQRICIARALALEPKLIVADESVAALDVSVRARVLDLMLELQETMGLAYLFISHDMAVIERMCHEVAVMRGGRIVEAGSRRSVFKAPADPYTRELMAAVPAPDPTGRLATALDAGEPAASRASL